MRKVIAAAFVSLDGVMQAPGGPDEDPTGGFEHGGWTAPYFDEALGQVMGESFGTPFDLLLGRKTYDIFAAHWPFVDSADEAEIAGIFNRATKYVASRSTSEFSWENSKWLGPDAPAAVRELKKGEGPQLLTQGSSDFVQTLLAADLIDEFRLLIFPVALGTGKKFFGGGTLPVAFRLEHSSASPSGVIVATYVRAGDIHTGSFALETPSEEEVKRRQNLT
jgi:dihydrofolate reductase